MGRPGAATTLMYPFWWHMPPSWRNGSVPVLCLSLFVVIGIGDNLYDSIKSDRPELRGWLRACVVISEWWTRVAECLTGKQRGDDWVRREWRFKAH